MEEDKAIIIIITVIPTTIAMIHGAILIRIKIRIKTIMPTTITIIIIKAMEVITIMIIHSLMLIQQIMI